MIKLLVILILLICAAPVFAQTATPTPSPTPVLVIPAGELSDAAQNADDQLNGIGGSLTAPGGVSIIPTVNWGQIFGYIKWLIAPPTGDELAGPFGPIMVALGALLAAEIFFLGVKGIVYLASFILTFVVWLVKLIISIISLIASILSTILSTPIGWLLGFLGL